VTKGLADIEAELAKEQAAHGKTKEDLLTTKTNYDKLANDLAEEKTAHNNTKDELEKANREKVAAETELKT